MKKFIFSLIAIFFANFNSFANDLYSFDPLHTTISWSADHFGFSSPSGKFTDVDGIIIINEKNPSLSRVDVTIKTNSLSTGLEKFDKHLKSNDFLDVENFPTAKFVSEKVTIVKKDTARVHGILTLKSISLPIILDVKLNKIGINSFSKKKTIGFSATTKIKRSDFNINYGLPGIGDNIKINIEAECLLKSEGAESTNYQESQKTEWVINKEKSKIDFKVRQENIMISGSFKKFDGIINFNKSRTKGNNAEIKIDMNSIDLNYAEALEIVKSPSWLSIKMFPEAVYKIKEFTSMPNGNNYRAIGSLKIKDKEIPLNLELSFKEYTQYNAHVIGETYINRNDFNIGDLDPKKSNNVENRVYITVDLYATRN